jgi:diaminohydroxyphosphoribosylaminopyrimidine deaminase / 5-amino-6-(5-phosphoribosylamino)uracil reductase
MNNQHLFFMQRAIELAKTAQYRTSPNPRVGCVLVKEGLIIGEGATQVAGDDHAEVTAIKDAYIRRHSAQVLYGSTAYVTLEPCNHIGRTGACSQALIDAGIKHVFALMIDPNPLTAGQGITHLRAVGVSVWCGDEFNINNTNNLNINNLNINNLNTDSNIDTDLNIKVAQLIQAATELNIGFLKRMKTELPWLRLKVATSLDGYIALPNGHSQWLTGTAARDDTHHWRASSCAVLTGIGTVLADNPLLNVRAVVTVRQPLRIVLDTHLRVPLDSQLIMSCTDAAPVLIIHGINNKNTAKKATLQAMGVLLLAIDTVQIAHQEQLNIQAVYSALASRGLNEIHCEAGSILNSALLKAKILDEIVLYQAPLLLGKGLTWADDSSIYTDLSQINRWKLHSTQQLGNDVRLILRSSYS